MDRLSTEDDEFWFDDNGLQNVFQPESWQEHLVPSDCPSESAKGNTKPSQYETTTTRRDEAKATKIGFDEREPYGTASFVHKIGTTSLGEPPGTVGAIIDNENTLTVPNDRRDSLRSTGSTDNLYLNVCHNITKKEAENTDGNAVRSDEVEANEAKSRSGRSAKDGGCSTSKADVELLSAMASFCTTFLATISWQFSLSFAVGILILLPSAGVEGVLTTVPINTLSVVGQAARMNCSTDLNQPVYWARILTGSRMQQWLYYGKSGFNGNNADGRFTIDKDETTGRYDIVIADVQPKDAGQYVCVENSGIGAKASAELVISDPMSCKSHIPSDGVMGYNVFGLEQDFIQVSCNLTYTGNLSPTIDWSWPGSAMESVEPMVFVSKSTVASTLRLSPAKERDNAKIQCGANMEGATQNSIDIRLRWESETVNVRYAEFGSEEVDACPGITWNLICNPQCSYHFEIKDQGCLCLYTYYDTGTQQQYQVNSDVVKCNDNDTNLQVVIIVATLAAVVTAGLVGLAIVVLVHCLKMTSVKRRPADDCLESDQTLNDDNPSKAMIEPTSISTK